MHNLCWVKCVLFTLIHGHFKVFKTILTDFYIFIIWCLLFKCLLYLTFQKSKLLLVFPYYTLFWLSELHEIYTSYSQFIFNTLWKHLFILHLVYYFLLSLNMYTFKVFYFLLFFNIQCSNWQIFYKHQYTLFPVQIYNTICRWKNLQLLTKKNNVRQLLSSI